MNNKCAEVKFLEGKNTKEMSEKINELTDKKRSFIGNTICDENGNALMDNEDIAKR